MWKVDYTLATTKDDMGWGYGRSIHISLLDSLITIPRIFPCLYVKLSSFKSQEIKIDWYLSNGPAWCTSRQTTLNDKIDLPLE